jgi:hypothetical protein
MKQHVLKFTIPRWVMSGIAPRWLQQPAYRLAALQGKHGPLRAFHVKLCRPQLLIA